MKIQKKITLFILTILIFTLQPTKQHSNTDKDYNDLVLKVLNEQMPVGGAYPEFHPEGKTLDEKWIEFLKVITGLEAAINSEASQKGDQKLLIVQPELNKEFGFCSQAIYLLLVATFAELQKQGIIPQDPELVKAITYIGEPHDVIIYGGMDGKGMFGHINSIGPGLNAMWRKADLGYMHNSFMQAKPGDFAKIFWTYTISKGEMGHVVLFLGIETQIRWGIPIRGVRIWSCNGKDEFCGGGYSQKWYPLAKVKRIVFCRLQTPENVVKWLDYPQ